MTTPMMTQYRDAKAKSPGTVLLFRMGDFFESFEEDAELIHRVLGVTLTSRDKIMPMAGFPHVALENNLRKLLQAGHRVAVCDQVEDAALAKGLVKRDITRIVSPGTVTEDELLDPRRPNILLAVQPGKHVYGLAWLELTTGEFSARDVPLEGLADELQRLSAAEALIPMKSVDHLSETVRQLLPRSTTPRPDWQFDPQSALDLLAKQFRVKTLAGFGFDDRQACVQAAGAVLAYVGETLRSSLAHLKPVKPYRPEDHLLLDEVTRRSLELTRTSRDNSREGSLLAALDRTVTPMGARYLHDALLSPLARRAPIEARLDAVEEFLKGHELRGDLRQALREAADLARLTTRVSTARANPRDLAAVARTIRMLPRVKAKLAGRKSEQIRKLESRLDLAHDLRDLLDRALSDEPPTNVKDGGAIRTGFSPELDELRRLAGEGKTWIARYQAREVERTGISSLKVGFNSVFGYYIEVTHAHSARVPADYVRKQTLKGAERYITPELKEYEEKILTAQDRAATLEAELFQEVRQGVADQTTRLATTAEVLAELDFLAGLAELAASRNYVRPILSDEPILDVREGVHPILDQTLPSGTFVPNDAKFDAEAGRFWLITGPNMAGKSVFIKQVALLTMLAHVGSFVPAEAATIGLTDRIFTRIGASDELNRGLSTFMVEMTETANILHNATPKSLVILDEVGRGTSTYDGVSLAWGITEHLHDVVGCRTMFATHYHELSQLAGQLEHLRNYTVLVEEQGGRVIFLHRIAPGAADKSYGIHVARLAGLPEPVLRRAEQILGDLESRHQLPHATKLRVVNPPERRRKQREGGPDLFGEEKKDSPRKDT